MPQSTAKNLDMLNSLDLDDEKSTLEDYKELDEKINSVLEKISERKRKKSKSKT